MSRGSTDRVGGNVAAGRHAFPEFAGAKACKAPMSYSSRSARRSVAAMATPISAMCSRPSPSWCCISRPPPSLPPNRPCRSAPAWEIERRLKELRPDADFAVCSNPEFLREGSAIRDFTHPDRVLVGCDSERGREVLQVLYEPLALRKSPLVFVSRESAQLAKYAANAFLAMKITFINEVADLCEMVGADVGWRSPPRSAPTAASERNSCMPVRVMVAPASPRTSPR